MKRLYTLLVTTLLTLSISAQVVNDTVEFAYVDEVEPGIIGFIWQGGDSCSAAYTVYLAQFDEDTYSANTFSGVAALADQFAITGYDGYFQCSTDIVLEYGDNYTTIGAQGATASDIAAWQAAWEASVNEADYTLKPGFYVIFVEGIDVSFNTTEVEAYVIVEVAQSLDGIDEIHAVHMNGKYVDHEGRLYILRDGKMYDINGNRLK